MLFKEETNCEKCIHKRVCGIKNQQDFCDAKREIEKVRKTISDILIFEVFVRCKEFREDVSVSVRTPPNIHQIVNSQEEEKEKEEEEEETYCNCNACVHFRHKDDIYYCYKGNIYPSEDPSPICIDCECYTQKEN